MNQQENTEHLTPEELDTKKHEMKDFYENGMPFLKAQLDYEQMLLDIDEVRLKRDQIQMQRAYMSMSPEEVAELEAQNNVAEESIIPSPKKKPSKKKSSLRTS